MKSFCVRPLAFGLLAAMGCGGGTTPSDSGTDAGASDAFVVGDAGHDAASASDSGVDAAPSDDAGRDAASVLDAGHDAAAPTDGGTGTLGDCETDADCTGGHCVAITAGGYRVCQTTPTEATSCTTGGLDACCTSADCTTGACFAGPVHPFCGGVVMAPHNECASDECASDGDCSGGVCAPAGTVAPAAICVPGTCRLDADCTAETGGHCILGRDPCCHQPTQMICSYPSDGCVTDADCTSGYCSLDGDRAHCEPGGPLCPL